MTPSHQPGHFNSWKPAVWKPITEEWQKLSSGFKKNLCIFKAAHKKGLFLQRTLWVRVTQEREALPNRGKEEWLLCFFIITTVLEKQKQEQFSNKKHSLQGRPENTDKQTVIKPLEVRNLYKLYMKNHILTSKNKVLSNALTMKIQKYRDLLHGDL